jgi:hypothetical protein
MFTRMSIDPKASTAVATSFFAPSGAPRSRLDGDCLAAASGDFGDDFVGARGVGTVIHGHRCARACSFDE